MTFSEFLKTTEKIAIDNSPTILTTIGVVGTIGTAILSGRASIKAYRLIELDPEQIALEENGGSLDRKEKFCLVWKEYIPAVGMGAVTIASIVAANRIGSRRAAALALGYSLSERAFSEYREKVHKHIGDSGVTKVKDEIAQDRVTKNPPSTEMHISREGDVLCFDSMSGRYFISNMENLRKAQNDINHKLIQGGMVCLSSYYQKIGLPPTRFSEEVGWNSDTLMEVTFSTTLSENDRPCIVLTYDTMPIRKYYELQ